MVVPKKKKINCETCRWAEWTDGHEALCRCRDIVPEGSFAASLYRPMGCVKVLRSEILEEIRDRLHDITAEKSDGGNGHDRKRA